MKKFQELIIKAYESDYTIVVMIIIGLICIQIS